MLGLLLLCLYCGVSVTIFYTFFKLDYFLTCSMDFCIFWAQMLYQMCDLQIFLMARGLFFHYLASCFHREHGFNFKRVFAISGKNSLPGQRSPRLSPLCPSSFVSFIMICFIFIFNPFSFRPMIHLELMFAKDVRSVSGFIYSLNLHTRTSSCSSTVCWKDCPFSIKLPVLLCQRSVDRFV